MAIINKTNGMYAKIEEIQYKKNIVVLSFWENLTHRINGANDFHLPIYKELEMFDLYRLLKRTISTEKTNVVDCAIVATYKLILLLPEFVDWESELQPEQVEIVESILL